MTQSFSESFKAIGTMWQIDFKSVDSVKAVDIFNAIRTRIEEFEQNYSRFRTDSLVSKIANNVGTHPFPSDAEPMINMYRELYEATEGKVTPLIGQALVDTGYDANYSLKPKEIIREVKNWDDVMNYKNGTLTTKEVVQLDFGALGKGYIVDIVSELLRKEGITDFTVEAGGDMHYQNTTSEELRVGLEHPEHPEQAIGIAQIVHGSICGSSGNRRSWGKYHHIINPNTLESPKEITALWVTADTTMLADGLATALFFTDREKLLKSYSFECVLVYADGSAYISPNFPGVLF